MDRRRQWSRCPILPKVMSPGLAGGDRDLEDVQAKQPRSWMIWEKAEGYLLADHLVWSLQFQSEPSTVLEIGSLMN